MDELEITELMLSEVLEENEDFRFEPEFFRKKVINSLEKIEKYENCGLLEISKITGGNAFSSEEFGKTGVKIARITEVSQQVALENWETISFNEFDKFKKNKLSKNDILMSGTHHNYWDIGKVIFINEIKEEATFNQRVFRISADIKKILPQFLFIFLRSKFGRNQIERLGRGNNQLNLNIPELSQIRVPLLPPTFQTHIAELVQTAHSKLEESKKLYSQAEQVLLEELGINDEKNETKNEELNISVKNFSQSFGVSGRLDAEYYQPKYDEILKKIRQFKHLNLGGEDGLVDIFKSIEPGSEAYQENGIPFVRVSNLNKNEISEPEIKLNEKQFGHIKKPKKDDILLSKDGSVGLAYKCQKDENFITSGAILHLTIKNTDLILPDYLTLVLNSKIVQLQAQRDAGGSIIQHWKPSEIEAVLIPLLPSQTQSQIAKFIQTSFKLRTESKELLERAKLEVEEEVEKG